MVRVLFIPVFDPKVLYHWRGIYVSVCVCPEALGDFCQCIDIRLEVLLECFICYDPRLHRTTHYLLDSDIDVSVTLLVE